MSRMIKTAIAAIIIATAATPAALAKPAPEPQSVSVDYRDLNLSTVEGGQTLLARIKSAARKSCSHFSYRSHWDSFKVRECRINATEAAVRAVNAEMLTLAWNGAAQPFFLASR